MQVPLQRLRETELVSGLCLGIPGFGTCGLGSFDVLWIHVTTLDIEFAVVLDFEEDTADGGLLRRVQLGPVAIQLMDAVLDFVVAFVVGFLLFSRVEERPLRGREPLPPVD